MPYINPATLIEDRFKSPLSRVLPIVPSLMANKRAQEQLAFQQEQERSMVPHRQAQTVLATEQAEKAKQARQLYSQIMGGAQTGGGGDLAYGIKPEDVVRHQFGLPKQTYRYPTVYGPKGKTKQVPVAEGKGFIPEEGESLSAPTSGQLTAKEWKDAQGNKFSQQFIFDPKIQQLTPYGPPELVEPAATKYHYGGEGVYQETPGQAPQLMPGLKKQTTPTENIATLKLMSWNKYLQGLPTSQQERQLIGVDIDRYIATAAQLVANDMKMWRLPIQEKVAKIEEIAQTLRAQQNQGGPMPIQGQQQFQHTATNPQGQKVGWDGQKWVPIQ